MAARRRHPTWGPRKLLAWLADRQPQLELPSPGRAAALLARKGLVKPRRRRRRRWEHPGRPRFETKAPNDLWTADFKGEFRLGTRDYCYPLTVADQHTRYLLGIKAMDGTDGYGVEEPGRQRLGPRCATLVGRVLWHSSGRPKGPDSRAELSLSVVECHLGWLNRAIWPLRRQHRSELGDLNVIIQVEEWHSSDRFGGTVRARESAQIRALKWR